MKAPDPSSYEDTVLALEATLLLLQSKSRKNKGTGACVWQARSGTTICVKLLPGDCDKIPGAKFVGGECSTALKKINPLVR